MRTAVKKTDVYTFSELSDKAKENALLEHVTSDFPIIWWDEVGESIKGFCNTFGVNLMDYEIACGWGRSYFRFDYEDAQQCEGWTDEPMVGVRAWKWLKANYGDTISECCPFTGVCYDEDLLRPFREFIASPDTFTTIKELIHEAFQSLDQSVQSEYDYQTSEEGFAEMCEANGWEFTENGKYYY